MNVLGGHIHQFDIPFPIKDEQQVVESMTSHLDKHPKIRLVVLGNERFNLLVTVNKYLSSNLDASFFYSSKNESFLQITLPARQH